MANKTFILNDQTKCNSHGFYLLNSGGNLDRFLNNPVMLDCHDLKELLGRWCNLKIEGNLITAEAEFDVGDEKAQRRAGQVERGFLKGASVGIIVKNAEYRTLEDKQALYVTDWELFEASIVTVPSNAGSLTLKLYHVDGNLIDDKDIKFHIDNIVQLSVNQNQNNMTQLTLTADTYVSLGIDKDADSATVCAAINALKLAHSNTVAELNNLNAQILNQKKERAEALVSLAITNGKISADKKDATIALALVDYEVCKLLLSASSGKSTIADKITNVTLSADRDKWTYFEWRTNDPIGLEELKINNPAEYSKITTKIK